MKRSPCCRSLKKPARLATLLIAIAATGLFAADPKDAPAFAAMDRAADGTVYYHEDRHIGRDISQLVQKCPFAYYPSFDFARFQERPSNWGVARSSYQDFAVYYANEFMKRGVSLYFDNTNIKDSRNRRFSDAYADPQGKLRWSSEIFGPRAYYRRIWKLAQEWNARGTEYPIDVTFHMTNTDELPFASWCTVSHKDVVC